VTNYGTIAGTGAYSEVSTSMGSLTNFGSITAAGSSYGEAVYLGLSGGSVINGAGTATGALISGGTSASSPLMDLARSQNYGTIRATSTAYSSKAVPAV